MEIYNVSQDSTHFTAIDDKSILVINSDTRGVVTNIKFLGRSWRGIRRYEVTYYKTIETHANLTPLLKEVDVVVTVTHQEFNAQFDIYVKKFLII